jgi:hypothetical protein|tara:strand:- start:1395 stop:1739 length:345 start_codon:yes stop_codon:yes gene_type:complete
MKSKLGLLLIGIFIGLCAIKIGPVYMSSFTVSSIVEDLATEAATKGYDRRGINERLVKRFGTNGVTALSPKDISIQLSDDEVILNGNYEQRIPFVFNIDVVVRFENNIFTAAIN